MRRFILLLFIAFLVFGLVLFVKRPELIADFYLWILGLIGPILALFKKMGDGIGEMFSGAFTGAKNLFKRKSDREVVAPTATSKGSIQTPRAAIMPIMATNPAVTPTSTPQAPASIPLVPQVPTFKGVTLRLVRISDDGFTTVGRLYEDGEGEPRFLCYTLEDTFRKEKIDGKTRIPAGTYRIDFNFANSPLTIKYKKKFNPWFTFHLHIKEVPGFEWVYIHNGGTHEDTEGCILISDKIHHADKNTFLTNSRATFKWFYQEMSAKLEKGKEMRIIIEE